jgi:anionic cell wall polymer biosynthesis LytR-Cps2A-Psr (LCP) family protein
MIFGIGIMDRDSWKARTDIVVVVDMVKKTITWVPRDVYVEPIRNRINTAYTKGGSDFLKGALISLGFDVDAVICVLPKAVNTYIQSFDSIQMNLNKKLEFNYPLHRHKPIEDGSKRISFDKSPVLSGDRVHEWIGARYSPVATYASDLFRVVRQMHIVKQLIANNKYVTYSTEHIKGLTEDYYKILCMIDSSFTFHCYDLVKGERINKMDVLKPNPTFDGNRRKIEFYQSLFS